MVEHAAEAGARLAEIIACYCEAQGVDQYNAAEMNAHARGIWQAIVETGEFPLITFDMVRAAVSQELMRDRVREIFMAALRK